MLRFSFIVFFFLFVSCKNEIVHSSSKQIKPESPVGIIADPGEVVATDYNFFSDSVFHGFRQVLKYYLRKYGNNSNKTLSYNKDELIGNFEGVVKLGFVRQNFETSVFVLDPLNYRKNADKIDPDGQAYYFTDTSLPRLQTNSFCCQPSNIFIVGDIDEDGISEIGLCYSSCASQYKSLCIFSLKNGSWKKIGQTVYDLTYMDNGKPYNYFLRKTGKNQFEMLQITDLSNESKVCKREWIKFSMVSPRSTQYPDNSSP